jgi:Asp-tRNA(Asn)/Glu-tRNA(Gln) amidotransferase A subunit family amidase
MPNASRRRFLAVCSAAGLGQTLLPGALLALATPASSASALAQEDSGGGHGAPIPLPTPDGTYAKITAAMIDNAAIIAGVTLSEEQKTMMLDGLNSQRDSVLELRKLPLPNSVAPAVIFDPVPGGMVLDTTKRPLKMSPAPDLSGLTSKLSAQDAEHAAETLAFATIRELAELVRTKRVSATTLTKMYLARLKRLDAKLHCVITLTEERALKQAAEADAEIASGHYRGPLHGIPWGAKDLLAVKGYPTTWGAAGFEDQMFEEDAEVVKRLDAAGAILIVKFTLGALAQGDLWGYPASAGKRGARTRNPWNTRQGSSGSSAGSASATAAGCVAFALGTETLGSISSPSTRCGTSGLRPTFGFVPRTGAMALSWTMDKIGPICRAVEDCALVMSVIHGPDGRDLTVKPAAFNWDANFDWKSLRIGYIKSAFDAPAMPDLKAPTAGGDAEMEAFRKRQARAEAAHARAVYDLQYSTAALSNITKMGVTLMPIEIPKLPYTAMVPPLEAEGAAAFDTLTRSGRDKLLSGQQPFDWPNNFRVARFYSAVDYIQAMRGRTLAIAAWEQMFKTVDVIVTPSQGAQLTATNLTGYPAIIVPNGLRGADAPPSPNDTDGAVDNAGGPGTPVSITFLGGLYADARLAAFARAYQQLTGFHKQHPQLG